MKRKVLIVEDSSFLAQYLEKEVTKRLNSQVVLAQSLYEARKEIEKSNEFSVAILDYNLPDAPNGEIISETVRAKIPSIVYTSTINKSIREKVWSLGVSDYILKNDTGSLDEVITTIERLESNKNVKIVICDDSPFFRKLLSNYLKLQNYQIYLANDGDECLALLKSNPDISLCLVDYSMPNYNGTELCQKIRLRFSQNELSIIGISSEDEKDMAIQFLKCGANDFIEKQSFLPEEFLCRVNQNVKMVDLFLKNKEAAEKDFLSNLYNRRYFFEHGSMWVETNKDKELTLAMFDIDFFKKINDTFGHSAGDQAIIHFSNALRTFSPKGLLARIGGEEFCLLEVVEKGCNFKQKFINFLDDIEKSPFLEKETAKPISYTVSAGVSIGVENSLEEQMKAADELLYLAKSSGRNCVCFS